MSREANLDQTVVLRPAAVDQTVLLPSMRNEAASMRDDQTVVLSSITADQTMVLPSIAAEIVEAETVRPGQPPGMDHRGTAKLGGAVFWSYVLTSGGTLVNALLQVGLTVILSPNNFGIMVLSMVWVTLALQLLAHGPSQAVVQADDMTDEHFNAAFWVTMLGALAYTALFVGLSPLWASVNHQHKLVPVCIALSPVILLHAARAIPDSVMLRRMEIRPMAVRNLIAAVVGGLVGVGMAVAGLGVWALVGQQLTTFGLSAIILWSVSPWRPHRPNLRSIRVHMRDLRSYSLQTLSGSLGFFISDKVDGLLMGLFLPINTIGQYRFASRFPDMASSITSGGVATVSLPEFARHNADRRRMAQQLTHLIRIATMLTFPALAILAAVSTPFVQLIGHQWEGSEGALEAMCLLYMVMTIDQLLAPALQAAERPGIATAFTWIGAVLSVIGFLAAIHWTRGEAGEHRIIVVALAVCAEHVVLVAALGYITFYRILKVSVWPTIGALIPATLSAAGGFAAGHWLVERTADRPDYQSLVISGAGAGIASIVLLLILERAARTMARKLLRKLPVIKKLPGIRERTVDLPAPMPGGPAPRWGPGTGSDRMSPIDRVRRITRTALLRVAADETAQTATRTALILAPHPDDETLGCGATILRKVAAGTRVTIAVLSDGRHSHHSAHLSPSALAELRHGEMAEAAARLGVPWASVRWGGFYDTELDHRYDQVVDFVGRLVAELRPDEIYATCADEAHPDHAAVGRAARAVVERAGYPVRLLEYPIWLWSRWPLRQGDRGRSTLDAAGLVLRRKAVKVKSSGYVSAKLYALSAHGSQLSRPDMIPPNVEWPGLPRMHIADAADRAELFLIGQRSGTRSP